MAAVPWGRAVAAVAWWPWRGGRGVAAVRGWPRCGGSGQADQGADSQVGAQDQRGVGHELPGVTKKPVLGEGRYGQVLADHYSLIRSGLAAHGGEEVDTQGDAFFAVFASPKSCVAAGTEMQQVIEAHAWPAGEHVRVRMG